MKKILFLFLLTANALGMNISSNLKFKSFEEAKKSETYLKFVVESTRIGLFSSDVDGYVLEYSYEGEFDSKNLILRNLKLNFLSKNMNTDHEDRDQKLHNLCMSSEEYPKVVINLDGPIFLKENRERVLKGEVLLRGKKKPFEAKVKASYKDDNIKLEIKTVWSLKEMEIPDPSIAVAKLSDEIEIYTKFIHALR